MSPRRIRSAPADRFDRRLLAPMMLGSVLNPINSSIIAVALVPIGIALGAPPTETAWLVAALYISTAIGQPLFGRLVDLYGARPLYLIGSVLAVVAGVLGVVAGDVWTLVGARIVLGFGTCAAYPAALQLIRDEGRRTDLARPQNILTALSVTTQTTVLVGPTLGGLLIDVGGWRAPFALNVPLGIATLVLGLLFLPAPERRSRGRVRIDLLGVMLFAVTLVSLLLFLLRPSVDRLWLLAIGLLAGAGFALRELRTEAPFIDVRVLGGNVPLVLTYLRTMISATIAYCFLYGFTQWLEQARGLSATIAGLVLLPTFAAGILVSTLTGRRPEVRGKLLVGGSAQLIACVLLLLVGSAAPIWALVGVALVLGVPQGLNNLANQNAMYVQADPARVASSAGLLRTFLYLGAITASTASGAFYGRRADTAGLHELAMFMLGASLVLLSLTIADRRLGRAGRLLAEPVD